MKNQCTTLSSPPSPRRPRSRAKLDLVDKYGGSALNYACIFKRATTALQLVEVGAALNLVDSHGLSALDYADIKGLAAAAAAIRARGGLTGAELAAARP